MRDSAVHDVTRVFLALHWRLAYVACNLGDKLDPEEAKEMIAVVDANGDGQVDADEFLAMRGAPLAAFEPEL